VSGDEYLQSQLQQILQPGEQVLHTGYVRRQPGILFQSLFFFIAFLMTKAYFGVLTNRRLILIRTKMGAWTGVQNKNLGVEEYDVRALAKCTTGGIANNRSMQFYFNNGTPTVDVRISPWFKSVKGTGAFFEQVPNLINTGQVQQMAGGQLPPGAPMGAPMQQGMQPMPGQQMQPPQGPPPGHMQQPPQMQQQPQMQMAPPPQGGPLQVGQQVMVAPGDGQRYPATIVQAANGQYMCQMPNGQPYWFPAQQVSVG
jgi:hypothetical protein